MLRGGEEGGAAHLHQQRDQDHLCQVLETKTYLLSFDLSPD